MTNRNVFCVISMIIVGFVCMSFCLVDNAKLETQKDNGLNSFNSAEYMSARPGFHEATFNVDNLSLTVSLEWVANFSLQTDYNAYAQSISFADVHITLNNPPYGYWHAITMKRWKYDISTNVIIFYVEGELCKYMNNEEHIGRTEYRFSISPRYNGYGEFFQYSIEDFF